MTQTYELKLEKFSGPLEKLLELIEEKKLQIAEISLAQVTDDFLKYFKALTDLERDLHLVADFISIASKLILIKSKFLLPDLTLTPDEEQGIKDLEKRLKMYQELKPVLKILEKLWQGAEREFGREYFLSKGYVSGGDAHFVFYPGKGLYTQALFEAAKKLFDALRVEELETKTIKEKIISIEEKIGEVIKRIENELEMNFSNLSSKKSRSEIVVIFLAILHLAREQLIYLEQSEHFSDIIVRKK
ncbi:MAG: segregation/condensation protein A [Candidatus Liptonbacteria bacterium]|nr:segregation/condensation protein A [Candidatus Liptonbacteria bacterium]